ncbi:MAG: hypothetical protein V3R81_07410 [Gammaproteobacteria bacterium]
MTVTIREAAEGVQIQGANEGVAYQLTVTNWASSPTSPSVTVTRTSDDTDVTSTVMSPNSPTVASDVITLSPLDTLTAGEQYRVDVQFTATGYSPADPFFYVEAE